MERIECSIAVLGVLLVALALTACGGDDKDATATGAAATDLTEVTTRFDNGQVETTGTLDEQGRRQGEWAIYNAAGQQLFTGHFVDGELDQSQPWTEWNPDGSVRYDHSDGPHPSGGPW